MMRNENVECYRADDEVSFKSQTSVNEFYSTLNNSFQADKSMISKNEYNQIFPSKSGPINYEALNFSFEGFFFFLYYFFIRKIYLFA